MIQQNPNTLIAQAPLGKIDSAVLTLCLKTDLHGAFDETGVRRDFANTLAHQLDWEDNDDVYYSLKFLKSLDLIGASGVNTTRLVEYVQKKSLGDGGCFSLVEVLQHQSGGSKPTPIALKPEPMIDVVILAHNAKEAAKVQKIGRGFDAVVDWGAAQKDFTTNAYQSRIKEFLAGKVVVLTHQDDAAVSLLMPIASSVKVIRVPDTFAELVAAIDTAPPRHAEPWRNLFKNGSEMEAAPLRWLIEDFMPEGTTFLGALSGHGKTWFALSMCKALVLGQPFLGRWAVPEPVPVIYMIPEAGERSFRKRMRLMGIPNDDRFLVRTMKDGLPLKLDDPFLLEAVETLKPVVVLDTAIRFSSAESENSASDNEKGLANSIFNLLRAGACAVLGNHHATKASGKDTTLTLETALRGSGDLAAMVDTAWGLKVLDPTTLEIHVSNLKPRDFDDPPMPFVIEGRPHINESGDFKVTVEPGLPGAQETRSLEEAIRANPTASYRELSEATSIGKNRIEKIAARVGYKKHGDRWVATSQDTLGLDDLEKNP